MIFLFLIYKWAILAGAVVAPALALIGCHLAARDRSMQTLCIGQGATLGVLVGLGLLQTIGAAESILDVGPFVFAAIFSAGTFYLSEKLVVKHQASRNTFYASIFGSLLALGYLVCAIFPQLDNHMTQVFFGDLATLSNRESMVSSFFGAVMIAILATSSRRLSSESFNLAVFGERFGARPAGAAKAPFNWLALVALAFSVQFLGFLFTISTLFLPTALALGFASRGLRQHFVFSAVLACVSCVVGFLISLRFSRLPTVPMIVVVMLVLGGSLIVLARVFGKVRRSGL